MEQNDSTEKLARFVIHIPPDMVEAVDDYWHAHKLKSRAEAGRQLLAYALEHQPKPRLERTRGR
jgi:metal-responsive CopG/Arc/MetJ family transcriptional regulator